MVINRCSTMELTCDGWEIIWSSDRTVYVRGGTLLGRDSGDANGGDGLKLGLKLFVRNVKPWARCGVAATT